MSMFQHDFVCPFLRLLTEATVSFPQSHWHSQFDLLPVAPILFIATSFPNLCPVMSKYCPLFIRDLPQLQEDTKCHRLDHPEYILLFFDTASLHKPPIMGKVHSKHGHQGRKCQRLPLYNADTNYRCSLIPLLLV